ncbi:MAG: hypothetical protein R3A48_20170 [Polyangiales bacterium]
MRYDADAIEATVRLTAKYVNDRLLPTRPSTSSTRPARRTTCAAKTPARAVDPRGRRGDRREDGEDPREERERRRGRPAPQPRGGAQVADLRAGRRRLARSRPRSSSRARGSARATSPSGAFSLRVPRASARPSSPSSSRGCSGCSFSAST